MRPLKSLALLFLAVSKANALGGPVTCNCPEPQCVQVPVLISECFCFNPIGSCNDFNVCCGANLQDGDGDGRRRHLAGEDDDDTVILDGHDHEVYRDFVKQCGNYEYEASLYVDEHVYALAKPLAQAQAAACPFVAVHAVFAGDRPTTTKQIILWNDQVPEFSRESLPMGTFAFSKLADAYESADPAGEYDILKNNCGNFIVQLASKLDIRMDGTVTAYVARRLLEASGHRLVNTIRQRLNVLGGRSEEDRHLRSLSSETLVEHVVRTTASALYDD